MQPYLLGHVKDHALEDELANLVGKERGNTALILAHIAEIEARKLFLAQAYRSMYAYCVGKLRLEDDWAYRRIQAARAARRHPAIFKMLADGRLTLTSVITLDTHLTANNAAELLEAAANKSKSELEQLLADRAPKPDVPASVRELHQPPDSPGISVDANTDNPTPSNPSDVIESKRSLAPERVNSSISERTGPEKMNTPIDPSAAPAAEPMNGESRERSKLSPLGASRFALQVTISQATRDKLRRAQELLGHQIPSGDLAQVLDRALDSLIDKLERRKFAKTDKPARAPGTGVVSRRRAREGRHVPAKVRKAVCERDQGQCTFVSESGHRCEERKMLEFDHVKEVARGGESTVANVRLRCRAHNQYTAEQTYGEAFMQGRREVAKAGSAARGGLRKARERANEALSAARERALEEFPLLRKMRGSAAN